MNRGPSLDPSAIPSPEAIFDKRLTICVGTGGVGKTTVSAAIALEAARRGYRTLVLTVDPARRLADALGSGGLDGEPRPLPAELREAQGIYGRGDLFAMMLDTKRTFDEMVHRFAPDAASRDRILANPIYAHLSDALAGSAEYAAMEQVHTIYESGEFDWIVVDTPPSQHALDFLEAPRRMLSFLDSRLVQALVHPTFAAGRFGLRVFHRATQRALKLLERASGLGFLEDLSEFLLAIEGMANGFRSRAHRVQEQLFGPESAFVLVAAPSPEATRGAQQFLEQLDLVGARVRGIIANRVHVWPDPDDPDAPTRLLQNEMPLSAVAALASALATPESDGTIEARAAIEAASRYASLAVLDERITAPLRREALERGCFYQDLAELPGDVHDLDGLSLIAHQLFGDAQHSSAPAESTEGKKA